MTDTRTLGRWRKFIVVKEEAASEAASPSLGCLEEYLLVSCSELGEAVNVLCRQLEEERQMHELAWPRKADVLITDASDWSNNACLNFAYGPDAHDGYARGYRIGAEQLTRYVIEENRNQDTLIYPIVFLWRHYTELRLKELLASSQSLLGYPIEREKHHKILPLWNKLRPLLKQIEPRGDKETLDAVGAIMSQLDAVDPDSITFRYPTNKAGEPVLPRDLTIINVRNFTEVMQRVANFLDAVDVMVTTYLDRTHEHERWTVYR